MRLIDERLNFNEDRTRAFLRHQHSRARHVGLVFREKDGRGIRHPPQAMIRHSKDAELVDGAEAVLEGAYQTEVRMRIALEIEDRIDDVLENARTGASGVLRIPALAKPIPARCPNRQKKAFVSSR